MRLLMRSVASVCVSVCVCTVRALTFESLENLFWYADSSSEYLGQVCIPRSTGQGQGHGTKNEIYEHNIRGLSAFDWKAISFWIMN